MDVQSWAERWREGRIGFHEGWPNAYLQRHVGRLGPGRTILVPLCGKAEDLAFLASLGHAVVGVEVVEEAVRAFFDEHALQPDVSSRDGFTVYRSGGVAIVVGDMFATTPEVLGPVDAFYDRAALVALPAAVRPRYVAHLRGLLPPKAPGLLVTFEYDPALMEGPPFAVAEGEVRSLYAGCDVTLLDEGPAENARLRELGTGATERCFLVRT